MAAGPYNAKSPTIKRILKEAAELSSSPSADYEAHPVDDSNIFEWHFTLRGPPEPSPYAHGLYHGRIILPHAYPLRPPSFRFMTPSGRFEPNREICLSISGHHEESWQPAWGIRTALVAIRGFMDSQAAGQLGGVDATESARQRLAEESRGWRCQACSGRSCEEIMKRREEEVTDMGGSAQPETVPEELTLGYRDELGKGNDKGKGKEQTDTLAPTEGQNQREGVNMPATSSPTSSAQTASAVVSGSASSTSDQHIAARRPQQQLQQSIQGRTPTAMRPNLGRQRASTGTEWLDAAIAFVAVLLGIFLIRKLLI